MCVGSSATNEKYPQVLDAWLYIFCFGFIPSSYQGHVELRVLILFPFLSLLHFYCSLHTLHFRQNAALSCDISP